MQASWLVVFTEIFTWLTASLAVWGMFISYYLIVMMIRIHKLQSTHSIRKSDVGCLCAIVPTTCWLLSCLFLFPHYASSYMFSIVVFEMWYATFAVFYTMQLIPKN